MGKTVPWILLTFDGLQKRLSPTLDKPLDSYRGLRNDSLSRVGILRSCGLVIPPNRRTKTSWKSCRGYLKMFHVAYRNCLERCSKVLISVHQRWQRSHRTLDRSDPRSGLVPLVGLCFRSDRTLPSTVSVIEPKIAWAINFFSVAYSARSNSPTFSDFAFAFIANQGDSRRDLSREIFEVLLDNEGFR